PSQEGQSVDSCAMPALEPQASLLRSSLDNMATVSCRQPVQATEAPAVALGWSRQFQLQARMEPKVWPLVTAFESAHVPISLQSEAKQEPEKGLQAELSGMREKSSHPNCFWL